MAYIHCWKDGGKVRCGRHCLWDVAGFPKEGAWFPYEGAAPPYEGAGAPYEDAWFPPEGAGALYEGGGASYEGAGHEGINTYYLLGRRMRVLGRRIPFSGPRPRR